MFNGDTPFAVLALDLSPDGEQISAIYLVSNPDKRPVGSAARNQRTGRYDPDRSGERNRARFPTPASEPPRGVEPAEPGGPDAGEGLFVTPAQLARANRLAELHWRRPAEDPRTRKCLDCRADGTCPRAAWADSIITRCLRTYWR